MILYGAGGHAKVILEMLRSTGIEVVAIYDDNPEVKQLMGKPVASFRDPKTAQGNAFIVSIGCNSTRSRVVTKLMGQRFGLVVDASAQVSTSAVLREGTVVMPGAIVNAASVIGNHCIINTGAVVEHDCFLADFVHIAPNATLCGEVSVGEGAMIGAGAVVTPGVKIGSWSTVGAGAVVIRDVPNDGVVVGNPAKLIKN